MRRAHAGLYVQIAELCRTGKEFTSAGLAHKTGIGRDLVDESLLILEERRMVEYGPSRQIDGLGVWRKAA